MNEDKCDIGTLASSFKSKNEMTDQNNVKVVAKEKLKDKKFVEATDFLRTVSKKNENLYHHVGIYAFTNKALIRYVSLKRSKLEIERKLEQMRAMENNLIIKVGLCDFSPLGVDTKEDLIKISAEMS